MNEMTLTLNSPITEEQWDALTDVNFDNTDEIHFRTKHGKEVYFVKRKTGKWIGADSQCGIGCPFCGTPVDDFCSSIDYIDLNYEPNFCPNCGAKMEGLYESD